VAAPAAPGCSCCSRLLQRAELLRAIKVDRGGRPRSPRDDFRALTGRFWGRFSRFLDAWVLERVDSLRTESTFTKPRYLPCFVRVGPCTHEPKIDRKSSGNRPVRASGASGTKDALSAPPAGSRTGGQGVPWALRDTFESPRGVPGGTPGARQGVPGVPRGARKRPATRSGAPWAPGGGPGADV